MRAISMESDPIEKLLMLLVLACLDLSTGSIQNRATGQLLLVFIPRQ